MYTQGWIISYKSNMYIPLTAIHRGDIEAITIHSGWYGNRHILDSSLKGRKRVIHDQWW